MAIEYGQAINLNRMQALNLVFHSSAEVSPPVNPVEGQPWYVTDIDVLRVYTGSVWNTLVVGPGAVTSGNIPTWNGASGGALGTGYGVVTTIGDPGADTNIPTEQAVREAIASAISSEVTWKGGYNAATNTPDLDVAPSGVKQGDMYYITVAGTFFTTALEAGDVIIANIDDADAEAEWTMVNKNISSSGVSPHKLLDATVHDDTVTNTVVRGSIIFGNSTPAWDKLAIGSVGSVIASDGTDLSWKKWRYCQLLATSAASYTLTHNLNTRRIFVIVQDTNGQQINVEWKYNATNPTTQVDILFGVAPTANTRIVTVYGLNFGETLDNTNA